jgi:hypothetical protein
MQNLNWQLLLELHCACESLYKAFITDNVTQQPLYSNPLDNWMTEQSYPSCKLLMSTAT